MKLERLCSWVTCIGVIVLVIMCVMLIKSRNCNVKEKINFGWSPPPPDGSGEWSGGSSQESQCKAYFSQMGGYEGDPYYYCDNGNGTGRMIETNNMDNHCSVGSSVAYTAADCNSPTKGGQGYLCGGPNFSPCQALGYKCIQKSGLPLEATGLCPH